jgi:hypothetical protein
MKPSNIGLAIWAKSQNALTGSGVLLLKFLEKKENVNSIFAIGLSEVAKPIYSKLGYQVAEMKHYAIVNANIKHFVLLKPFRNQFLQDSIKAINFDTWIKETDCQKELKGHLEKIKTFKTFTYVKARYLEHPVYEYKFAILGRREKTEVIIIFRVQSKNFTNALRLVDVLGDQSILSKHFHNFQTLLTKYRAEYIHFYTSREIDSKFVWGCVLQIDQDSKTIVPNYFEPFSDQNIFLDYCVKYLNPASSKSILYLGDSDQDRPNIYNSKTQVT